MKVENENLKKLKEDHFHHLAIGTNMKHFNSIFSDVKVSIQNQFELQWAKYPPTWSMNCLVCMLWWECSEDGKTGKEVAE